MIITASHTEGSGAPAIQFGKKNILLYAMVKFVNYHKYN